MENTVNLGDDNTQMNLRENLIASVMEHAIFDGWSKESLKYAALDLKISYKEALALFPSVPKDLIFWHNHFANKNLLKTLHSADLTSMKIREKIAFGVIERLLPYSQYRQALRQAIAFCSLPQNLGFGVKLNFKIADTLWRGIGDQSHDWNYYSKRTLLVAVYTSTLIYWLDDDSEGFYMTKEFLNRRINDVLKIPSIKAKVRQTMTIIPRRLRAFKQFSPRVR